MLILHVNKFYDLQGGAEVYLHRLMAEQRAQGHELHAFSTSSSKNLPSNDSRYFVTRYNLNEPNSLLTQAKIAANFLWNLEAKSAFGRELDDLKPDIIHLHNIYHHLSTSILSEIRKRGIPCVQTLHDYKLAAPNYPMFDHGAPCERAKGGKYYKIIKHRCLSPKLSYNALVALEMYMTKAAQSYERTVALFLCPSRFIKEKMIDWGEPAGKMRYVPNPAELSEKPVSLGGGYLIFAGRLSPEKGLDSFIEAAAKIPELPIKIAGRGPEEGRLRALVKTLGAHHIEFLGFQAPDVLKRLRDRAEALILPTLSYENASTSVLEAMGDGLPCLVTRTGGNPELIEDGVNGFLAKPGDSQDWLRVLRRFQAVPPEARRQMGEASRAKIRHGRTWPHHLELVMHSYEEAGAKIR